MATLRTVGKLNKPLQDLVMMLDLWAEVRQFDVVEIYVAYEPLTRRAAYVFRTPYRFYNRR